ncbi:MAG: glutamate racemase [Coriobacteriia bacterium]|nr:glutamate racemase [Coriobacteriia bacterium]
MNTAPIGIFDSGLGGLTVAREIAQLLPHESLIYLGDQARCPYGPRDASEIQGYVHQIISFLQKQQVKLIVIACNTATSCALEGAVRQSKVPVIGVINAGARAAAQGTQPGTVAVIGTQRTIESEAYPKAMAEMNDKIKVIGRATPKLTTIVESDQEEAATTQCLQKSGEHYDLIEGYLRPLLDQNPDALLLGCTHYPILSSALQAVAGAEIQMICSAAEVAKEVKQTLKGSSQLAHADEGANSEAATKSINSSTYTFYTTSNDTETFAQKGSRIFGKGLGEVRHVSVAKLEES